MDLWPLKWEKIFNGKNRPEHPASRAFFQFLRKTLPKSSKIYVEHVLYVARIQSRTKAIQLCPWYIKHWIFNKWNTSLNSEWKKNGWSRSLGCDNFKGLTGLRASSHEPVYQDIFRLGFIWEIWVLVANLRNKANMANTEILTLVPFVALATLKWDDVENTTGNARWCHPDHQNSLCFHSGNWGWSVHMAKFPASYWNLGWKNPDFGNQAWLLIWAHREFYKGFRGKWDLGNRASLVNWAHVKKALGSASYSSQSKGRQKVSLLTGWGQRCSHLYCETHETVNTRNIYGMLLCCEK